MQSTRSARAKLAQLSHATIIASILAAAAGAAHAQQAASSEVGEVIVTAQRRAERIQDVPIAISAVSADTLADRNVDDLTDLRSLVPGLVISGPAGANATNLIAIRGIAGQPLAIGGNQATAVYLDGVYLSRPDAAVFTLDDVERIEVLRGPQGTLYGRNATSGAINIITRDPGKEVRGGFDVNVGNYDSKVLKGSLSGPLAGGFSAGISGSFTKRNGYFLNTVTGGRIDDRESFTLRGKLRYATEDGKFSATLAADQSAIDGENVNKNQYVSGVFIGIGDADVVSVGPNPTLALHVRSRGTSGVLTYRPTDSLEITSVTGYRHVHTFTATDLDASPLPLFNSISDNHSKAFNQELRGVFTSDQFRATVGGNYYRESATFGFSTRVPFVGPYYTNPFVTNVTKAWAVFGQFEYDFTDQLTLVAGIRYNKEKRDGTTDYRLGTPGGRFLVIPTIRDDVVIPSVGVNFQATPDLLVYAKVSRGYQAPGFNLAPGAFVTVADTFDAEKLTAYEAGVKSQFLDRRVTLNVAAFYYDYKDLQVRQTLGPGVIDINNAATASIKGLEAETRIQVVDGLTLSGQLTYLDATYGSFCEVFTAGNPLFTDPPCVASTGAPGANRHGNRLTNAPKWSGGLNLNYRQPVAGGEMTLNLGYTFESTSYFTTVEDPVLSTRGWDRFDARVGYQLENGPEFYAFGRNLTDKRYINFALRANAIITPSAISEPRTYGVGARYRF